MNFFKFNIKFIYPISSVGIYYFNNDLKNKTNTNKKYTYEEIKKHNTENDIWIIYKNQIYDVTNFLNNHPGGKDKLMLAAGNSVEPYWNVYKQHYTPEIINNILDPMKIGTIKDYNTNNIDTYNNPYINEPLRSNLLKFHTYQPCNAETPISNISNNWITPNNLWYIRNHSPVPNIDVSDYKLSIICPNKDNIEFNLETIKKYPSKDIITTIQCGGNRRSEYNKLQQTSGTLWENGAISTAKWTGVLLKDIIDDMEIDMDNIKHVHFIGYDDVKASIPIEKVLNNYGDVLLAYKMNDGEIPRDHGYPLRIIVPGYVGIRNIKWIKTIEFSDTEVDGPWQQGISYKGIPHYITDVNKIPDLNLVQSIYETPVQSCITEIENTENIIKGYAWSGGGRNIIRVDVSYDNGKTWNMATLKEGNDQTFNKAWAWTFWEYKVDKDKCLENVMCKAIDNSYNVQSNSLDNIWNIRGLLNNIYHTYNINNTISTDYDPYDMDEFYVINDLI